MAKRRSAHVHYNLHQSTFGAKVLGVDHILWPRSSENSLHAKFAERGKGEVRRIHLLGTSVHKGKKKKGRDC